MAMKVKLFLKFNPMYNDYRNQNDLEQEINDWLATNPAIKISNVLQSVSPSQDDRILWSISIWYED